MSVATHIFNDQLTVNLLVAKSQCIKGDEVLLLSIYSLLEPSSLYQTWCQINTFQLHLVLYQACFHTTVFKLPVELVYNENAHNEVFPSQ
ncbi:MAG: hypothetical protein Q8S84_03345 [bacterium]|nr:hypothetical protein [bacterium]MDP3380560.1 hypothetical protein [bacterium]